MLDVILLVAGALAATYGIFELAKGMLDSKPANTSNGILAGLIVVLIITVSIVS